MKMTELIQKVRCDFAEFLEVHGQLGCQWVFSCEQDVQAFLYRMVFSTCQHRIITEHTMWLGVEAQPRWFLFDQTPEFFQAFGFQSRLTRMRKRLTELGAEKCSGIAGGRLDLALLASRNRNTPHLHVWETKFFSFGRSLQKTLISCKTDSSRLLALKKEMQPFMHLTGEVIWIDRYTSFPSPKWKRICDEIHLWNRSHRSVPIRLWAFSNAGEPVFVGFPRHSI